MDTRLKSMGARDDLLRLPARQLRSARTEASRQGPDSPAIQAGPAEPEIPRTIGSSGQHRVYEPGPFWR
jgi:hypothetical protein